uniref:Uncharacterized protein n=1 Tax=Ascaris lumbricoides TaxID=6252 RepID=A0A0M3IDN6_ASCLU
MRTTNLIYQDLSAALARGVSIGKSEFPTLSPPGASIAADAPSNLREVEQLGDKNFAKALPCKISRTYPILHGSERGDSV